MPKQLSALIIGELYEKKLHINKIHLTVLTVQKLNYNLLFSTENQCGKGKNKLLDINS
jgi:hypothetical protein